MSSVGSAVGAVIGGALGFFLGGGPVGMLRGASWGMSLGGYLDPPKGPSIEGPRLTDLSSQSGSYGIAIPRIYGTMATYGNVFWLENNKLKEVVTKKKQKSGGKGGGGSSSTTITYTYFATFAVGLCEGPIAGIRRIWIGSKLFYDAGSSDISSVISSNNAAVGFTLYTGTNTQTANYRMQAQHGANTPAYRGLAYIVFYDLPLLGYGNSMMGVQVKVEVITQAITKTWLPIFVDYDIGVQFSSSPYATANIAKIVKVQDSEIYVTTSKSGGVGTHSNNYVFTVTPTGVVPSTDSNSTYVWDMWNVNITGEWLTYGGWINLGLYNNKKLVFKASSHYDIPGISDRCVLGWGDLIPSGQDAIFSGTSLLDQVYAYREANSLPYTWWTHHCAVSTTEDKIILFGTDYNQYVVDFSGNLLSVSTHGLSMGDSGGWGNAAAWAVWSVSWDSKNKLLAMWHSAGGSPNLTKLYFEDSSGGYPYIDYRISTTGYFAQTDNSMSHTTIWLQNNIIYEISKRSLCIFSLTQTTGNYTLGSIVQAECLKSQTLSLSDIDTSELTNTINGYKISNEASLRSSIEPLQGAYHFDVYQQGYKIKFKSRGSSSVVTIAESKLGANNDGSTGVTRLTESREMTIQLPKSVSLKFFDLEREYDTGEQVVERISSLSNNKLVVDLPLSLTATEAIQKADILLYLYWLERSSFSFTLPPTYINLEPSDVITISSIQGNTEYRITDINYINDGRLECKAKVNKASSYTSVAYGESGQSTGDLLIINGSAYTLLIDPPCITNDFNIPAYCVAMGGFSEGWPGAVLYRSKDTGQLWETVQGFNYSNDIGTATNTISTWNSYSIDYKSTLIYSPIIGDQLVSVTQEQMLNGSNVFAYGINGRWEIILAQNCILQGDGTYILSNLLRGRAGTEHNTGNHVIGDYLVLLDSQPALVGASTSDINNSNIIYRSVPIGRSVEDVSDILFTYTGNNLKCLSPVYLRGFRQQNNDWLFTWIRRSRIDGEWRNYVDVPIGETSEAYEIDIYSSGFGLFKRTLTSNTPTVTYTSAQQVTDFGSNIANLSINIFQLSSQVGRGIPASATF